MSGWRSWHDSYDDPSSPLSRRLVVVRRHIARALDGMGPGPRRVLSLCAGDGRDLLPVLTDHPRGADVRATLVELDEELAARARRAARELGDHVRVQSGDAGLVGPLLGDLPVDLLLLCGIFGNVPADDVRRTVAATPGLLAPEGTVIWTRGGSAPDMRPVIRRWFEEVGLVEVAFDGAPEPFGVGVHRRPAGDLAAVSLPQRLFAFTAPARAQAGW